LTGVVSYNESHRHSFNIRLSQHLARLSGACLNTSIDIAPQWSANSVLFCTRSRISY